MSHESITEQDAEQAPRADLEVLASLKAMQRRLGVLESVCFGRASRPLTRRQLVHLYIEATRFVEYRDFSPEAGVGWARVVLRLDEPALVYLGRKTKDEMPWLVFLRLLEVFRTTTGEKVVRAAELHLREVARGLLDAKGLGIVELEDVMNRPPAFVRALRSR